VHEKLVNDDKERKHETRQQEKKGCEFENETTGTLKNNFHSTKTLLI